MIYLPNPDEDHVQVEIAKSQKPYEARLLTVLTELLEGQQGLFVDVGAHVGNHSLTICSTTQLNAICIEPNQVLARAIESSAQLNNWENRIKVLPKAAGIKGGRYKFHKSEDANLGKSSVTYTDEGEASVSIDDEVAGRSVACLKVDVEGSELETLYSAAKTLAEQKPLVVVECQTLDDFNGVANVLEPFEYIWLGGFEATLTHIFGSRFKFEKEALLMQVGSLYEKHNQLVDAKMRARPRGLS